MKTTIRAVLWDFGGVILESPFEAFDRYERSQNLPPGFLRGLNTINPHDNAWARLERGAVSIDEFCGLYEAEALIAGYTVSGIEVLGLLSGSVRSEMVEAVRRCQARLKTAMLTNNFAEQSWTVEAPQATLRPELREIMGLFDVIIESSRVGVRKPDPQFYELACEALTIHPTEAVFLDDLGINLKPARDMGMHTIKVTDPDSALAELEGIVGFALR